MRRLSGSSLPTIIKKHAGLDIHFLENCIYPGPEVLKLFAYKSQLSIKFILLVNVKMPTIVGILTFISRINTRSEGTFFICRYFSFYEPLEFRAHFS